MIPVLIDNHCLLAGAIFAVDAEVHIDGHTTFTSNYAINTKGGEMLEILQCIFKY